MKRTIFLKIFSGMLLVILLLSAAVAWFSSAAIRKNHINSMAQNMVSLANALIPTAAAYIKRNDLTGLEAFAVDLEKKIGARITVIKPDGMVIADSENNPEKMENHLNRPEITEVVKYGREHSYSVRYSSTMNEKMLYLAVPVKESGAIKWIVRLSVFLRQAEALVSELTGNVIKITAWMLLIATAVSWFIARRLSEPVRKLSEASKCAASGNFDMKLEIKSGDEIQEAAESFNFMTSQVKKLFGEITARKEELNTIISSINEALLVTDEKGKIVLSNAALTKMLTETYRGKETGKYFWEIMISSRFNEIMEKAGRERAGMTAQLEINGRHYLLSVNYLSNSAYRVAIMYDVTGMKEFEEMKKDFVANVSHERKTPLAAIKGYTETLLAETKDTDSAHYLSVIARNTDRLAAIVNDLLVLTRLEGRKETENFGKEDLREIAADVIKIFTLKTAEKGLELKAVFPEVPVYIKADRFRIEQLLINLIDNAVKYTDEGGVTLSVTGDEKQAFINVSDTGTGIPAESMPRLFERFYTVDKSRSRKLGGTGLGLSIVKHIVLMHNGEIKASSEPGKGTLFTVILPIDAE